MTQPGDLRPGSPAGRLVLAAAVLGSGMAMLDGTVVTVALPRIGAEFGVPLSVLQWTVNAYMLTLAGLMLLGGALGDRYGRRRVFALGVVWFAVASVLCGLAWTDTVLIAARALQGVGGALLTPGSLALIQASFRPEDRARAVGLWSGLGGVAIAVGPFLGGWLVDGPGWRWIFYINVPLAAVVLLLTRRVPESRDPLASGRFDITGGVLAALSLAGITHALIEASGGPEGVVAAATAAGGVLCGVLFVRHERRTPRPMLPLSLFRSRLFTWVNVVTLCLYAAIGGVFFLLPTQLQNVVGYDAMEAGIASLPVTLLMIALSGPAGELAQRTGPRLPLTAGPLVAAVGVLLLGRARPGSSYWPDVFPATVLQGLGMSLFVAPLTATVLAAADTGRAGTASGVNNAAARIAQLLAVAALPLAVGLSSDEYRVPEAMDRAFAAALPLCAGLMVLGALISRLTMPTGRLAGDGEEPERPQCTAHCGLTSPPLEPGRPDDGRPPAPDGGPGPPRGPET